ncbi:unnamed protein product [Ambrosiozyma monospora]|uniref:Unnamed protein product n=1 Tax=Ambrosiozyma monospora TaxID=43982 RepID=A0ACB5SUA9_AMBMO|nr:unnamed protein product [Ambrosiozyma monospora]
MTVNELINTDSTKVRIFIVRHGQTDWNTKKILQGHKDISLNENGQQQAQKVAERLTDFKFDQIVSSDLTRCLETLQPIINNNRFMNVDDVTVADLKSANGDGKDGEVKVVPAFRKTSNLRERQMGPVEGMYIKDAIAKYGEKNYKDLGETKTHMIERVSSEWETIWKDSISQNQKNVLLCTHGGVITNLSNYLFSDVGYKLGDGLTGDDLRFPFNTSVTVVDVNKEDLKDGCIAVFGSTLHLGAERLKVADQRIV